MGRPIQNTHIRVNPTMIDANTRIEGNIVSKGEIKLRGVVTGDVSAKAIFMDRQAICTGTIYSDHTVIAGQFDGNIISKHVEIKSTAKVNGHIEQNTISVDAGAKLNAKILTKT